MSSTYHEMYFCYYCAGKGCYSCQSGSGKKVTCVKCDGHGSLIGKVVEKEIVHIETTVTYYKIGEGVK